MESLASCQYNGCQYKDTCKRYNLDTVTINFKFYYEYNKNKCPYYIQKEKQEIKNLKLK